MLRNGHRIHGRRERSASPTTGYHQVPNTPRRRARSVAEVQQLQVQSYSQPPNGMIRPVDVRGGADAHGMFHAFLRGEVPAGGAADEVFDAVGALHGIEENERVHSLVCAC